MVERRKRVKMVKMRSGKYNYIYTLHTNALYLQRCQNITPFSFVLRYKTRDFKVISISPKDSQRKKKEKTCFFCRNISDNVRLTISKVEDPIVKAEREFFAIIKKVKYSKMDADDFDNIMIMVDYNDDCDLGVDFQERFNQW